MLPLYLSAYLYTTPPNLLAPPPASTDGGAALVAHDLLRSLGLGAALNVLEVPVVVRPEEVHSAVREVAEERHGSVLVRARLLLGSLLLGGDPLGATDLES